MKQGLKWGGSAGVLAAFVLLASVQVGWAAGQDAPESSGDTGDRYEQPHPSIPPVLIFRPESSTEADLSASWDADDGGHDGPPGSIRVFYPVHGQSSSGSCWMGLAVDSGGWVYPFFGNVSRIRSNGRLVNGADDSNYFATGGVNVWFTLDEEGGFFYNAGGSELYSAPFHEGSTFSPILSGFEWAEGITLGQGVWPPS